ncbi:hypothetical protein CVIRNUC_002849 [Coccomyxa viridis]|uniref:Uncharacterized protein n=1 Tax=Coccomyxa viridis TaxID=1274662 RepID=A0AAV1I0L0_9CHLO|nr:hypothetical protein CVIRNUC_002849 [Coccomyxa viridis]
MDRSQARIDIVPSGEALTLAAKILGVKDFAEVIASEGQGEAKEEFRPPLLGLGADPQKQGTALSAAMKVERRLAQRIKGSSAAAGVKASDASRKHGAAVPAESSESEEDEDLGRAGAILRKSQPAAQAWSQAEHGKTRKRKKGKKQKLGNGQ